MSNTYIEVKNWMYRNARHLEICLWRYLFEEGSKEEVIQALRFYQNEDGGFGHALEPDNWNPDSTPITTNHALKILKQIDFFDMEHEIYQGIWRYLDSNKGTLSYGWSFTIPTNDDFPHAPWWNYSEEQNRKEYYGVTAELSAFILQYGDPSSEVYQRALIFVEELLKQMVDNHSFGDMGIEGYITLLETVEKIESLNFDCSGLSSILGEKIKNSIEYDIEKWSFYGVRPSNYIKSPENRFYEENAVILHKELQYLLNTRLTGEVWGITWTWFDNMERYEKEFRISENWWKGIKAIENVLLLKSFGRI